MGIIKQPDPFEDLKPKDCFYCGEPLWDDSAKAMDHAVYWSGCTIERWLGLHPGCATVLGAHLIADARDATRKQGGYVSLRSETKAPSIKKDTSPQRDAWDL